MANFFSPVKIQYITPHLYLNFEYDILHEMDRTIEVISLEELRGMYRAGLRLDEVMTLVENRVERATRIQDEA